MADLNIRPLADRVIVEPAAAETQNKTTKKKHNKSTPTN
jgi:co-chaperonin GroES (HSP10)